MDYNGYYYSVNWKDIDDVFEFQTKEEKLEWVAEWMADDYVNNHDGWELRDESWPIKIYIWDYKKKYLCCVSVFRDWKPVYDGFIEVEE